MEELLASTLRGETTACPCASREDDTRFLEAASRHRVESLVARALHDAGALAAWPEIVRDRLSRVAVRSGIVTQLMERDLKDVLAALASAGVFPLLLKGAGLAYTCYPDPHLRPRLDTDLLVRQEDVETAGRVLEGRGYGKLDFVDGELVSYQTPYARSDRHGVQHVYDVHWKIANPQAVADCLSYDELEANAVAVPRLGPFARTIDPIAALLLACVHRAAHHSDAIDLLWLYDIHLLASRLDERGARAFATLAAQKRVRTLCARGLALSREWFGTRVPAWLIDDLGAARGEAAEAYLAGHLRALDVLLSDVKALPGWRARGRLLLEHLLPSAAYMHARYGASSRALLPILYARRVIFGARRWFRPIEEAHLAVR